MYPRQNQIAQRYSPGNRDPETIYYPTQQQQQQHQGNPHNYVPGDEAPVGVFDHASNYNHGTYIEEQHVQNETPMMNQHMYPQSPQIHPIVQNQGEIENEKEKYERYALNDAQSVAYTAYTMNLDSGKGVVDDLRNVGVTVLSLESLSTAAMIHYMDAVTTMRLGNENDEKCMLYTDRMGRVFNVVISGGAEGLAKTWLGIEAEFSGLIAVTSIPILLRVVASFSITAYQTATVNDVTSGMLPATILCLFGFVLKNETSHCWLSMSMMVRGSNSVGAHVWRSISLVDYPRLMVLLTLTLASFAPSYNYTRDLLTIIGTVMGILIIMCNLGSRAWKKLDIGFIDSTNFFSPVLVLVASIFAGLTFPYVGLRSVHGGTDDSDNNADIEKITYNPIGKRARQNVTLAATVSILAFLVSDIEQVQESLGYDFSRNRGTLLLTIGTWWLFSSVASLSLCHRLDSSQSKKIEPFLKRDETSPVGWIVPSIPNILIDPSLTRGKMIFSFLSFGSDILCTLTLSLFALLIVWMGIKDINGEGGPFWQFG